MINSINSIDIEENIKRIRGEIAELATKLGRDPNEIKLVAAAKTKPAELVRRAINAGVDAIGENRVQEMLEKSSTDAYFGTSLHFIGHLQSNKVKNVVGLCDIIESVGSMELLKLIGEKATAKKIIQDILIEINIGREQQKTGIAPEMTEEMLELASKMTGVRVLGLMAVPPIGEKSEINERNCNYFDAIYKLYVDMRAKKYDNASMRFLSMGMSDSYTEAIIAGSNMVRIGSAIFGGR